jgi:hypothetical protein
MELNYWKRHWPLNAEVCSCDVDFAGYLNMAEIQGKIIFHFGTGEHHIVGYKNLEFVQPNEIIGITASREEHDAYVEMIIKNPFLAQYYKVLFADIYTLTPGILPDFDVVTLFHLCEFYSEANGAYTQMDDRSLLRMFVKKLRPGGLLLLYLGSGAYEKAKPLAEALLSEGDLFKEQKYKSLEIYRKPADCEL